MGDDRNVLRPGFGDGAILAEIPAGPSDDDLRRIADAQADLDTKRAAWAAARDDAMAYTAYVNSGVALAETLVTVLGPAALTALSSYMAARAAKKAEKTTPAAETPVEGGVE